MATTYHEPTEELSAEARNVHRALTSIIEELEAVDWYNQRVDVMDEPELKEILAHNRDEEMEHAAMTLEWLRRRMPKLDEHLRTYLFTEKPIMHLEEESDGKEASPEKPAAGGDLGVGKNK